MYKKSDSARKFIFSLLTGAIFLQASISVQLFAEDFRIAKLHELHLPQNYSTSETIEAGVFDGLSIILPEDRTFISGIEINIKVPEAVATWRDTVAYSFYEKITPQPQINTIDYSGARISIDTIPGKLNHTIYVPLNEKFSVKESPYAAIISPSGNSSGKAFDFSSSIFMRFLLVMKGAPESLEYAKFEISVKPVLSDEGLFSLTVNKPEDKQEFNYAVYIDDEFISGNHDKLVLKTGEHQLSITSEAFRNEVRTFIVEQAKNTNVAVNLRGIEPTVRILSPENSKIFLDGSDMTSSQIDFKEPFVISTGEHTVKFIIGDYEISKTLNAINGRSYTVNLNVDATVSEDE